MHPLQRFKLSVIYKFVNINEPVFCFVINSVGVLIGLLCLRIRIVLPGNVPRMCIALEAENHTDYKVNEL